MNMNTIKEAVKAQWKPTLAAMAAGTLLWGPFLAYALVKG